MWLAAVIEPRCFDTVWNNADLGFHCTEYILDMVEHVVAAADNPVALLYQ